MSHNNYLQQRAAAIQQAADAYRIKRDNLLYGQYTLMSANLSNYLPDIEPELHMELFRQLLIHKRLSKLEQGAAEALQSLTIDSADNTIETTREKPAIYCTFHTGSYRIINLYLIRRNIPFSLVIGTAINQAEGADYLSLYHSLSGQAGFSIINAESATSGIQMLRELKAGRSLLLYMDGNTGAGNSTARNENCCLVDFLGQQLYARKGIGYLAHAANVPIIPVISYRPAWDDIRLRFFDKIVPGAGIDRNNYAISATQQLYDIVAPYIQQYPEQWEAWLYLHKVVSISTRQVALGHTHESGQFRFNLRDFGVFGISNNSFLFNKTNYTSYAIDSGLYGILKQSIDRPVNKKSISPETLRELEKNGVLY